MPALRSSLLVLVVGALLAPAAAAQARAQEQAAARIINGTAPTRAWPAQTSVRFTITSGTFVCGGTLVSARWVLTAGHCASDDGGAVPAAGAYVLNIGGTTRTNGSPAVADQVVRDPSFTTVAGVPRHDLALLHLTSAASQEPLRLIAPAETALWSAGVGATVIGWGVTQTGSQATTLREAQVPMVSDASCSSSWSSNFVASTMVCAGGGLTDTCGGDSGGPLMVPRGGAFVIAGVTSWGSADCGSAGAPGVYARLGAPSVAAWVRSLVPTVSLTSSPVAPLNGEAVNLTATVSNAGQTVTPALTWDTDDDGAFDDASGPNAAVTFATGGSHVVRVRSDYAGPGGDRAVAREVVVTTATPAAAPAPPPGAPPPAVEPPAAPPPAVAATPLPAATVPAVPAGQTPLQRQPVALPTASISAPKRIRFGTLRSRDLRVSFQCTAACSISGRLTLAAGTARSFGLGTGEHRVTIGRGRATRGSAGRGTLVARLTARARRALRHRERATLTLVAQLLAGDARLDATRRIAARR